jgi:nucleoside phosphorylase
MTKHTIHGLDALVDIGILTIRDDEFRAVLEAFPEKAGSGVHQGAHRRYILRHADTATGERYTLAILRQVEQGNGEAQDAARDLIDDLTPRLVLVVGIAGGLPSDDVTLGDVVLGTRIHDYTVDAVMTGHQMTYAATGGPIDKAIAAAVATLAGREDELGDWTSRLPARPEVAWADDGQIYGPPEWQRELRAKLVHHHGGPSRRAPTYVAGAIASSDRLVKDPTALFPWITTARNLLAIEMESGGVYRAVRERCPMLPIRGISDLVGLRREDAWTRFACASAASFARAFLRTRPVSVATARACADPR